jgi:hypothetical protein
MFEPLGKLLPKSVRRAGVQRRNEAAVILEKAAAALSGVFGQDLAARMRPSAFSDGEIVL